LSAMAGLPPFISFSTNYLELNSAVLRHTGNERFVRPVPSPTSATARRKTSR